MRLALGISQEEAAERAVVPWQRVENGDPVTIKTLVAIAGSSRGSKPPIWEARPWRRGALERPALASKRALVGSVV